MAKSRSGGGNIKSQGITLIVLILIVSAIFGWAKVNNINNFEDGYKYFKAVSDDYAECVKTRDSIFCLLFRGDLMAGGGGRITWPGGTGEQPGETTSPEDPVEEIKSTLSTLTIAPAESVAYVRSEWKHWTGSPCNVRKQVLIRDGQNVTKTDDAKCTITGGTWLEPYALKTLTDQAALDIDHVIPLSYAAQHGGQAWPLEQKEAFANDMEQLLAVDAGENRSKGDKGPEAYMPPNKDFHCSYSTLWVKTVKKYGLSITEGDKRALEAGLLFCPK